jgi:hypothetical protein
MFRILLSTALFIGFVGLSNAEDKTYTIKVYNPQEGDLVKETSKKTEKGENIVTIMGNTTNTPVNTGSQQEFTEKVLKVGKDARKPISGERKYSVSQKRGPMDMEMKATPLQGKTFVYKLADGKYSFTLDGKDATAEDVGDVAAEFGEKVKAPKSEDMLPEKPVKVGDTWKLSREKVFKPIAEALKASMTLDEENAVLTGKLLAVSEKNGAVYGKMEFIFELTPLVVTGGGMNIPLEKGSQLKVTTTIEIPIDGTKGVETSKEESTVKILAKLPNNVGEINVDIKSVGESSRTPVK